MDIEGNEHRFLTLTPEGREAVSLLLQRIQPAGTTRVALKCAIRSPENQIVKPCSEIIQNFTVALTILGAIRRRVDPANNAIIEMITTAMEYIEDRLYWLRLTANSPTQSDENTFNALHECSLTCCACCRRCMECIE